MVREDVLASLTACRGQLISGGVLSRRLGVSRNAVSKAVAALQEAGHRITAVPRSGYRLEAEDDLLSEPAIAEELTTRWLGRSLRIMDTVDSTNRALREAASAGAVHGTVLLAENQQAGKGRRGRTFFSPAGQGVYMSLLLRPLPGMPPIHFVTLLAALSVCQAVEDLTGLTPAIKWVNDVLCGEYKLCGILTEAAVEGETGVYEHIVTGIGINVHTPAADFPEGLRDIARSLDDLCGRRILRCSLIAAILNRFEHYYESLLAGDTAAILGPYRARLALIGRTVTVYDGPRSFEALVLSVDDQGYLRVEDTTGMIHTLTAGEISIGWRHEVTG